MKSDHTEMAPNSRNDPVTGCHEKEAPIFEEHENLYFDSI